MLLFLLVKLERYCSFKVNMTKQLGLFEVPSVTLRGGEGGGVELSDIMTLSMTKTCL